MDKEILKKIGEEFKTPTYVFDIDALKNRTRKIKDILGESVKLCYAIKANAFLINSICDEVDSLEVCSPGEMEICKRNNIPPKKIIFSGVNKTYEDLVVAYEAGVKSFTVESIKHLRLINKLAISYDAKIQVLLRITSNNQFGMDEDTIIDIIKNRCDYNLIEIMGLHYFSGTQKKQGQQIIDELKYIDDLCGKIYSEYGFTIKKIEYGPGLKMPYFTVDDFSDSYQPLKDIKATAIQLSSRYELTFEMGRFFAGDCGHYITAINDLKVNNDTGYCIVDGGINHISYYGQTLAMKKPIITHIPMRENDNKPFTFNICGSLCTTADVIVKGVELYGARIDDLLVFHNMGGYSITEGVYLFLSRDMPRVVMYSKKNGASLVRDYIKTDKFNSI